MFNHLLDLLRKYGIPNIEEITLVTLRSLRELIREILFHFLLSRDLTVHILDTDLIPVRCINELNILHFEEVFLPAEYGLEMILGYLTVR